MGPFEYLLVKISTFLLEYPLFFDIYGDSFSFLVFAVFLLILGMGYLGIRGAGLWAKSLAVSGSVALIFIVSIAVFMHKSHPLRVTEDWFDAQQKKGGVALVGPPMTRPNDRVEIFWDNGKRTQYLYLEWTPEMDKSAKQAVDEYIRNKRQGQITLKKKYDPRAPKGKAPEAEFVFYWLPPKDDIPPEKMSPEEIEGAALPETPDSAPPEMPWMDTLPPEEQPMKDGKTWQRRNQ